MLALGSGGLLEAVRWIWLDHDLGLEAAECARQRNDLDEGRGSVESDNWTYTSIQWKIIAVKTLINNAYRF